MLGRPDFCREPGCHLTSRVVRESHACTLFSPCARQIRQIRAHFYVGALRGIWLAESRSRCASAKFCFDAKAWAEVAETGPASGSQGLLPAKTASPLDWHLRGCASLGAILASVSRKAWIFSTSQWGARDAADVLRIPADPPLRQMAEQVLPTWPSGRWGVCRPKA